MDELKHAVKETAFQCFLAGQELNYRIPRDEPHGYSIVTLPEELNDTLELMIRVDIESGPQQTMPRYFKIKVSEVF